MRHKINLYPKFAHAINKHRYKKINPKYKIRKLFIKNLIFILLTVIFKRLSLKLCLKTLIINIHTPILSEREREGEKKREVQIAKRGKLVFFFPQGRENHVRGGVFIIHCLDYAKRLYFFFFFFIPFSVLCFAQIYCSLYPLT